MQETPPSRLRAYGVAVLATAVCLLIRLPLWPVLGDAVPHMTFFPAVMIAAYYGGLQPGLLATLLGAVAANTFLAGQRHFFQVGHHNDLAALTLFVVTSAIISGLCESLHRTQRRLVAEVRMRAEETVRETEQRFRQLAENIHEIFWIMDAQGERMIYSSPGIEEVSGRTRQFLYEKPHAWTEIIHADDRDRMIETVGLYRRGIFREVEFRLVQPNGSIRWLRSRAFPINDPAGRLSRIAGLAGDITERKHAEQALRESEQRWRNLTEALPQFVWTASADGTADYFSAQITEYTGRPESELLAWSWMDLLHSDDRDRTRNSWLEAIAKQRDHEVEHRIRGSDGTYRWFTTRGVPIKDTAGQIVKWFGTCTDITEHKRSEQALRESEQRWRSLTEALPQLVWTATSDGACNYFSMQWTQFTGVPETELLGWQWMEALHPEDREPTRQLWTNSVAGRGPYDVEYRVRRMDGEYRWFKTRGVPIRDSEGRTCKWFGTCTDITDAKLAAEELRLAKEAAESANRAKDEFLANVSHEIRTPMNAILGMTELALDTPLTEDQRQCLQTVKSAADNLLAIINDLLDFAKIEAGKLELDPADFSLRTALGDTMRALAIRAHKKGLELVSDVQPNVPDALIGDVGRLRQVLLNLVGNAIKFTEEGEVVVRVETAENPMDSSEIVLRFRVADTGIGIPKDKQQQIFRAFEQEDTSTTRKYGGTGLGLTISAQLVALMSGQIDVESEPGRGSTFAFTARFGRQLHPAEPASAQLPTLLNGMPVLIVDDNVTNRQILERWLHGWRMKPAAAGDGLAALDALWHGTACGHPYPLVLLDARMPDVDGLALAAQIRQRSELSATRIILLTSGDRPGDLARSRELRVDAHLLKPVQQDELLDTIRRVMNQPMERIMDDGEKMKGDNQQRSGSDSSFIAHPFFLALRILVAEDNEFNAQLLEHLLGRRGHRVQVANDGREALALVESRTFDLMFLDIHMPELDGFQVVRAIRERERNSTGHLPIIALTARSRKEDRQQCLAAGMDDFLAKPIQAADLWTAIERVVKAHSPAGRSGPGLLDPRVLLAACGGDPAILEKIGETFRRRLPDHLAAVQEALHRGDAPRLREAAHKLTGMLAAFSTVAGNVASDLEDHAARGHLEEAGALIGTLEEMAQELLQFKDGLSLETLRQQAETWDEHGTANRRDLDN